MASARRNGRTVSRERETLPWPQRASTKPQRRLSGRAASLKPRGLLRSGSIPRATLRRRNSHGSDRPAPLSRLADQLPRSKRRSPAVHALASACEQGHRLPLLHGAGDVSECAMGFLLIVRPPTATVGSPWRSLQRPSGALNLRHATKAYHPHILVSGVGGRDT